jgi:alpha-D-ribose 1-methylphosphonate 5-triphosphate diphosphatase
MNKKIIRNARIITANEIVNGSLVIEDGVISKIDSGISSATGTEDWAGDWLMPGLVELHTDNLEKHLSPRPGVRWNAISAMLVHDSQCAAAGITTVLDSIVIGDMDQGGLRSQVQHESIAALEACRDNGLMRAEHLLHLRCEVSAPDIFNCLETHIGNNLLKLVSVMDHTPGQRQWRDMHSFRRYTERHGSFNDEQFSRLIEKRQSDQTKYAAFHRDAIVTICQKRNIPLASHDDTDVDHVEQAANEKIAISEFPTTIDAAYAARSHKMQIVMGSPNMVKGGSHSGNVSAAELAQRELLDIFSSDYVPASLLISAFMLYKDFDWSLPKAIRTVSMNPSRAIGLLDRGEIGIGKRADLIRVKYSANMPIVAETYCRGNKIH